MAIVVKGIGVSDETALTLARKHKPVCTECEKRPVRVLIVAVGVEVAGEIPCMPIAACENHVGKLEAFESEAVIGLAKRIGPGGLK